MQRDKKAMHNVLTSISKAGFTGLHQYLAQNCSKNPKCARGLALSHNLNWVLDIIRPFSRKSQMQKQF